MVATPDDPAWRTWLDGRWTKTVRRGTGPQLAAAAPYAATEVSIGGALAYGFAPVAYAELPAPLIKMQVAHFERDREGDLADPGDGPVIGVNPAVEMSTGKSAAQASHGIYRWWIDRTEDQRSAWVDSGHPLWIRTAMDHASWMAFRRTATGVIHDSGLTETAPGTLTVAVMHR